MFGRNSKELNSNAQQGYESIRGCLKNVLAVAKIFSPTNKVPYFVPNVYQETGKNKYTIWTYNHNTKNWLPTKFE